MTRFLLQVAKPLNACAIPIRPASTGAVTRSGGEAPGLWQPVMPHVGLKIIVGASHAAVVPPVPLPLPPVPTAPPVPLPLPPEALPPEPVEPPEPVDPPDADTCPPVPVPTGGG